MVNDSKGPRLWEETGFTLNFPSLGPPHHQEGQEQRRENLQGNKDL